MMTNSKNNLKGSLLLTLAAIIWGSTFVAQEEAARFIGAFSLNFSRSFVGAAVLLPLAYIFKVLRERKSGQKEKLLSKTLIIGGVCCGLALSVAANLQQFGIVFNAELASGDSGKAGFITAMYIIFVPFLSLLKGKKLRPSMIIAVIIGVVGLYFISVKQGLTVSSGDIVLFLCAIAFSLHIMVVDHFVSKVDPVALSAIQFLVVGVVSGILMLIFEPQGLALQNFANATIPILYCGIMSSGIAYTLQLVCQKITEPTVASLVMSLESLFAMVTACVFYSVLPTGREAIGCILMMVAIFVVETPFCDRFFQKIRVIKNAEV